MTQTIWKPRGLVNAPENLDMPNLVWQVLYSRGLQSEDAIQKLFSPSLKDLKSPFELIEMDLAVERLIRALKNNEPVCVYADFDLDGTSGLALLYDGLRSLGFQNVMYYQPRRLSEGYGIHKHAIDILREKGAKVLITVDVGITAIDEIAYAKASGIDVVVTDHHLPKQEIPKANAVVNPNREDCKSRLGHLSGAGVAFYLVLALRSRMRELQILENDFDPKKLLDCFVIGTLSDMVPLVEENRVLVKHGLVQLENTTRPGLRALLRHLNMERSLSSQDVAIGFVPKLNALSRMETSILPIDLFFATEEQTHGLIHEVIKNNEMRKEYQVRAESEALSIAKMSLEKPYVWVYSSDFHKGVIGLVATKIAQTLGVPAFVGSIDKDGNIVGSSRLPDASAFNLTEILESAAPVLERFGGHAAAAGFALKKQNAQQMEELLQKYFSAKPESIKTREVFYDAKGRLSELNPQMMSWYEKLGPFGAQFPVPCYLIENVAVAKIFELRGGHIKFSLRENGSNTQAVDALCFSPASHIKQIAVEQSVDLIAEPQWNHFNGRKSLQLLVRDIKAKL